MPTCSHAQILGTLQAYQHWLSELYLSSLRQEQSSDGISLLVSAAVGAAVPVISHEVPEKVALSASRLLLSLATTVRPCFLARVPAMRGLMDGVASGQLKSLPLKVHSMTCEALTAMLVLPWPSLSQSEQVFLLSLVCLSVCLPVLINVSLSLFVHVCMCLGMGPAPQGVVQTHARSYIITPTVHWDTRLGT